MRGLVSLIAGAVFGAGLHISGMTNTTKVQGFLDFFGQWDPTLMFVMGGAIIPMIIAWRLTCSRSPVAGGNFPAKPVQNIDGSLLVGAVLFGIGWGLAGLCPGPALASLSYGGIEGIIFAVAMVFGMIGAVPVRRHIDRQRKPA